MAAASVVILGATGFAGRNTWEECTRLGFEVHGLSRTAGVDLFDLGSTWRTLEKIRPAFIVNCAAHVGSVNYVGDFAADVFDDNMRMLLNVYKVAQQMRECVIINPLANCAFPSHLDIFKEADLWSGPLHPSVLSYGATRRMMDVLAACYHQQYGVRTINLIVPNMYGPYDAVNPNKTHALNALVIKFVRAVRTAQPEIEVWGTGRPVREGLFVKDFSRIVAECIQRPSELLHESPINIGQADGKSVDELVSLLVAESGYKGNIRKNLSYPDGAPRKVMSADHFRRVFPNFSFTPMDDGLKQTVAYYKEIL